MNELESSFAALEEAQRGIVEILLDTRTRVTTVGGGLSQTPHAFFLVWLQSVLRVNIAAAGRPQQPPGVADHTVLASLQSALMHAFVERIPIHDAKGADGEMDPIESWLKDTIKDNSFVTETVSHYELTRLGGLLSEVRRCYNQAVDEGKAPNVCGFRETPTPEFELLSKSSILYHLSLTQPYRRLQMAYKEVTPHLPLQVPIGFLKDPIALSRHDVRSKINEHRQRDWGKFERRTKRQSNCSGTQKKYFESIRKRTCKPQSSCEPREFPVSIALSPRGH